MDASHADESAKTHDPDHNLVDAMFELISTSHSNEAIMRVDSKATVELLESTKQKFDGGIISQDEYAKIIEMHNTHNEACPSELGWRTTAPDAVQGFLHLLRALFS